MQSDAIEIPVAESVMPEGSARRVGPRTPAARDAARTNPVDRLGYG